MERQKKRDGKIEKERWKDREREIERQREREISKLSKCWSEIRTFFRETLKL